MSEERPQEREEFSQIVEKYSDYVYNIALRMTSNPHDAEDIMQEVFLSAFKGYASFRGQAQVSTWLYRITTNACLMKIRKEKKSRYLTQTGYEDMDIPDWASDSDPARATVNAELRKTLEEGIARLPPDLRSAIVLRDVQGFSGEEAVDILEISLASLKSRLHRGRILLRKHLEGLVAQRA